MGISKQGIFGPLKGRTGNVVGSFWKGINVTKIRPANYSDANTDQQQNQRLRFKLVNAFSVMNKDLIRIGFSAFKNSASPHNRAIKYNLANAVTGEFPNFKVDLNLARISFGDLENIKSPVVTSPQKNTLQLNWTDNSGFRNAQAGDNLFVSVMDESGEEAFINDTVIKRSDKTALIVLPSKWSGKNVTVMGFTADEKVQVTAKSKYQISNSRVFGSVVVM